MTRTEWLSLIPMLLMLAAVFGVPMLIVFMDIHRQSRALNRGLRAEPVLQKQ